MSFSLFISSRYLTSRKKGTFISIISFMSVLGVAIGVAALVIVMSVYNGVTREMREKILGANPHVMVMTTRAGAFGADGAAVIDAVKSVPGVESASPFLYAEVLLSTPQGATGLVLRGLDPALSADAMPMLHHLESGSLENLSREDGPAGMLVGQDLARRFHLQVGSRVNLMSPAGQRTTAGFVPKLRSFRVEGIFKSGMSDFDSRLAYVSLSAAQELMGYVSGGLVFFGGVFGALPAAYLSARAYRVKLADFLPVLVPCTAVIGCLGRVGCFCAGCCYGVESGSCLAVVYPEGSLGAPAGVPLLPVQLFEAAWQLAIFLLLLWFTSRPARARFAAEFYILLYSPARFALEFLRGDAERGFLFGLSTSQWLALVSFLGASLCIFMRLRAKKPD